MDWLRENWFWIVVLLLFFWMHMKMHGGHGSHGGHGGRRSIRLDPHTRQRGGRDAESDRERGGNGGSHAEH